MNLVTREIQDNLDKINSGIQIDRVEFHRTIKEAKRLNLELGKRGMFWAKRMEESKSPRSRENRKKKKELKQDKISHPQAVIIKSELKIYKPNGEVKIIKDLDVEISQRMANGNIKYLPDLPPTEEQQLCIIKNIMSNKELQKPLTKKQRNKLLSTTRIPIK